MGENRVQLNSYDKILFLFAVVSVLLGTIQVIPYLGTHKWPVVALMIFMVIFSCLILVGVGMALRKVVPAIQELKGIV